MFQKLLNVNKLCHVHILLTHFLSLIFPLFIFPKKRLSPTHTIITSTCPGLLVKPQYREEKIPVKTSRMKKKSRSSILWQTWDKFWQETSISGVSNAGKARSSKTRRLIWLVLFAVGSWITIDALYDVFVDWMSAPITTQVSIDGNNQNVNAYFK